MVEEQNQLGLHYVLLVDLENKNWKRKLWSAPS